MDLKKDINQVKRTGFFLDTLVRAMERDERIRVRILQIYDEKEGLWFFSTSSVFTINRFLKSNLEILILLTHITVSIFKDATTSTNV
jgi:hypothetical protein